MVLIFRNRLFRPPALLRETILILDSRRLLTCSEKVNWKIDDSKIMIQLS